MDPQRTVGIACLAVGVVLVAFGLVGWIASSFSGGPACSGQTCYQVIAEPMTPVLLGAYLVGGAAAVVVGVALVERGRSERRLGNGIRNQ